MLKNVKPLARASGASFTEMEIRRSPTHVTSNGTGGLDGTERREVPTTTIRIKRMSVDDQIGLVPDNSTNLHTRLSQVLGRSFEIGVLDDDVVLRVKQVQKHETASRTTL